LEIILRKKLSLGLGILTKFKIEKDRYMFRFEGNNENVPFDQEAFDIWKTFCT
jgi:hypothetical protein